MNPSNDRGTGNPGARRPREQKQASQYARSLIEASLDPLVTISPEGKITDVNEGSIKVTGVPRAKLVGTDFSDYFTEPEQAREGYQQVFAKGFVTDYPLTIRHKDGRLTDVLYNASVYKDAGGNVLGDRLLRRRAALHRVEHARQRRPPHSHTTCRLELAAQGPGRLRRRARRGRAVRATLPRHGSHRYRAAHDARRASFSSASGEARVSRLSRGVRHARPRSHRRRRARIPVGRDPPDHHDLPDRARG